MVNGNPPFYSPVRPDRKRGCSTGALADSVDIRRTSGRCRYHDTAEAATARPHCTAVAGRIPVEKTINRLPARCRRQTHSLTRFVTLLNNLLRIFTGVHARPC